MKESRLDHITEHVNALPVGLFADLRASNPEWFIREAFHPDASVRPYYHCHNQGGWIGGHTVVTPLPNAPGIYTFLLVEINMKSPRDSEWKDLSAGDRISNLIDEVSHRLVGGDDILELADILSHRISPTQHFFTADDSYDRLNITQVPGTYHRTLLWRLHHVLSVMEPDERAAYDLMTGLSAEHDHTLGINDLLAEVGNVVTNWERDPSGHELLLADKAIRDAVQRYNGTIPTDFALETSGLPGVIMRYPADEWNAEADHLVANAFLSGYLREDMFGPAKPEHV